MRTCALILILVSASSVFANDTELEEKTVLDGKVKLLLPKSFKPMSEETLKLKYPRQRPPTLVYSNEPGTVNIAFNHAPDRMPAEKLPEFHKYVEGLLKKQFPTAKWFRSELTKINQHDFVVLDLRTPALDAKIRNIMAGTSLDDRLLMISFNTTEELEDIWLPVGKKIIESIRITK